MYTRCPNCSATFRITDRELQMADGDVQCGSCEVVFNALRALFDDSGATVSQPATAAPVSAGPGTAAVETEETLEFNAPEQDWQRFFIAPDDAPVPASGERAEPNLGADFDTPADAKTLADTDGDERPADLEFSGIVAGIQTSVEDETADTDTWKAFLREAEPEQDDEPPYVIANDAGDGATREVLVRHELVMESAQAADSRPLRPIDAGPGTEDAEFPDASRADDAEAAEPAMDRRPGADAIVGEAGAWPPSEPAETILDWNPPPAFTDRRQSATRHPGRWLAASIIAAMALAAQAIHQFRDSLAADPRYGASIHAIYERLNQPLYPKWPLDAYEIRGAKAIVENSAPGTLDIIAEIAVTGRQPVGLPMVRVVLRDRWSNPLASGVFAATDYLAEAPTPSRAYAAGTLIPVAISLEDPGTTAQGYELDVCIPDRNFGLQCKAARDPFRR